MIQSLQRYEYTIWACWFFFCFHSNSVNFLAFIKVTLPIGLLFRSFSISFVIVKEMQMTKVIQRNRYYHSDLVLIQHFFSNRCLEFPCELE